MNNNEKNLYIGVGVLSVVVCGFLFFKSQETSSSGKSGVTFGQLDHMKKELKIRKNLESQKVSVENYATAPSLSNSYREVEQASGRAGSVVLESEKLHATQEDLGGEVSQQPINMLEAQINKKLLNDQRAQQMTAVQKEQFILDYKKKALAAGYVVELSDDLTITKVQKVAGAGKSKAPASVPQEDINIQEEDYEYEDE